MADMKQISDKEVEEKLMPMLRRLVAVDRGFHIDSGKVSLKIANFSGDGFDVGAEESKAHDIARKLFNPGEAKYEADESGITFILRNDVYNSVLKPKMRGEHEDLRLARLLSHCGYANIGEAIRNAHLASSWRNSIGDTGGRSTGGQSI